MEPMDDFDSLLKGAAGQYNEAPLTEQSVSRMIDERLIISRKRLIARFRSEIILIIICALVVTFTLILHTSYKGPHKFNGAPVTVYVGTVVYLLASLFVFIRLMLLLPLQKGTDIRDYVRELHRKTQHALQVYLWLSDIAGLSLIAALLTGAQRPNWYWIVFITAVSGVIIHYTNIWYIRRRFGKRLDEIKALVDEFS